MNEHTLPRVVKTNVTSDILLVLIRRIVINYTYYVNLYFAYEIQIHVKTGILKIISRIQTNNVVVNNYLVRVTVVTSLASKHY